MEPNGGFDPSKSSAGAYMEPNNGFDPSPVSSIGPHSGPLDDPGYADLAFT
jgi:hypothetical protein